VLVIDASAAVELLLTTPTGRAVAEALVAESGSIHAPELIGVEIASVLRRLVRIGEIDVASAERALADFGALGVETYEHQPLLARVFALRDTVTAYDACYVALAEGIGAPILTCDAKLAGSHGHKATFIAIAPR
jgi:predicted nucleic acid-binding protein